MTNSSGCRYACKRSRRRKVLATACVLSTFAVTPAFGEDAPGPTAEAAPAKEPEKKESLRSIFFDEQDGALDLSNWLLKKKGFLPVPIIITEPAVGYGGGLAAVFFSQSIEEAIEQSKTTGHRTPPDVYALAAAKTENGTDFIGGGGMVSFLDDRWRYRGFVGHADLHLDFYGGGNIVDKEYKIAYQLNGWFSYQQALYRLGESDNFVSARWLYMSLDSSFDGNRPNLPQQSFAMKNSGIGTSFEHDSRDNIFTPSRGVLAVADAMFYDPDWGGDTRFQTYRAHVFAYHPVGNSLVLAGRLDGRAARGDVPFYMLPYLDMRGMAGARYQDRNTALAEVEARWNVTPRWGLIGFVGAGRAWGTTVNFNDATNEVSKGVGFRYQIARLLGVWTGMDYAWGPDGEQAFYIQVGSAWR